MDVFDLVVAVCTCGCKEAPEEYSELHREKHPLGKIPVRHLEKVTSKLPVTEVMGAALTNSARKTEIPLRRKRKFPISGNL